VVGSVEELPERSDDGFGGLLQRRELRQLPSEANVDARANIGGQEKLARSRRRERTVFWRADRNLAGAAHPFTIKDDTKSKTARCASRCFRRGERRV
jgi:hypothetical protein